MELLKLNHIPFRTKVIIQGREVDFLVGTYAIDIEWHLQDPVKNEMLANLGYIPVHLSNRDISKINVQEFKQKNVFH